MNTFEPIDGSFSTIRYLYRNSYDYRSSLVNLSESVRKLSGSMYRFSVQEGANLSVIGCISSSDNKVVYGAENGSTTVPLSYTLR